MLSKKTTNYYYETNTFVVTNLYFTSFAFAQDEVDIDELKQLANAGDANA